MADRKRLARESARAATGIVAIAIAVAAVGAAIVLPLPGYSVTPASKTVDPVPTSQQRVCPGPLYELAADSSDATELSAFGSVQTVYGTGTASSGSASSGTLLAVPDDSTGGAHGAPRVVSVPVSAGSRDPGLAAAQSQTAAEDDLTGFAAAGCAEPSSGSWLVGGATTLGQTTLVLLSNPGSVQATVDLQLYGGTGPIASTAATGILVPPHSQKVVPLSGLAPSTAMPVVHVSVAIGQVLASLQQSYIDGIQPEGAELVGPTAGPATHQVISGLTIAGATPSAPAAGSEDYPVAFPALRVLDTGSAATTVRIGIAGESGTVSGNSFSAAVQPGQVTEVPLTGLSAGSYTVTVDAGEPVVVAARTTSSHAAASTASSAGGTDFAWYEASEPLSGPIVIAVPQGPGATVHVTNESRAAEKITVSAASGAVQHVSVPAQTGVGVRIAKPGVYTVSGGAQLVVSVGYSGPGALSSFAVDPPVPLAAPITIYPR